MSFYPAAWKRLGWLAALPVFYTLAQAVTRFYDDELAYLGEGQFAYRGEDSDRELGRAEIMASLMPFLFGISLVIGSVILLEMTQSYFAAVFAVSAFLWTACVAGAQSAVSIERAEATA